MSSRRKSNSDCGLVLLDHLHDRHSHSTVDESAEAYQPRRSAAPSVHACQSSATDERTVSSSRNTTSTHRSTRRRRRSSHALFSSSLFRLAKATTLALLSASLVLGVSAFPFPAPTGVGDSRQERRRIPPPAPQAGGLVERAAAIPAPTLAVRSEADKIDLDKRWPGYATTTVYVGTVTVTAGGGAATATAGGGGGGGLVTVTQTIGPSDTITSTNTVTITAGSSTVTVTVAGAPPPGTSTTTIFVGGGTINGGPTTIQSTSTVTIGGVVGGGAPGGQATVTSTYRNPTATAGTGLADDRPCAPGEADEKYPGTIAPTNPTQTSTLYAIAIMFVAILVGWNLFIIRQIIYPAKLLVVAWHEFGHVVAAACSGARLESVSIDPNDGGATRVDSAVAPVVALPAGYIASILIGGALTFCGFDTLASKIASFIVGISWIVVFWWAAGLITRVLTLAAIGLMIALWFIDHASALRYYILFLGVMSSWYVIYDCMDDFIFRKVNPCCPVLFEERFPRIRAGLWALIWTAISLVFFIGWILAALAAWRETPRGMYCQSQEFLPT